MVSKWLMGFWSLVDFLLLAGGGLSVALSILWRKEDLLMNSVLTPDILLSGLVLGIFMLITFVVSIGAIVQANHITMGLVILNYFLVIDSIVVLVVGTYIWIPSLTQRAVFHKKWIGFSREDRIKLQDTWKCCGYFNASDFAEVGGTFCTQTQVDFLNVLDLGNDDNAHFFCVKPYTANSDYILENVFTTVYAMMVPVLCLLLASICVIYKRNEEERFKRIDAKRGGKGFV